MREFFEGQFSPKSSDHQFASFIIESRERFGRFFGGTIRGVVRLVTLTAQPRGDRFVLRPSPTTAQFIDRFSSHDTIHPRAGILRPYAFAGERNERFLHAIIGMIAPLGREQRERRAMLREELSEAIAMVRPIHRRGFVRACEKRSLLRVLMREDDARAKISRAIAELFRDFHRAA